MIKPLTHLSGLPVEQFMQEDWHIKPRLFKQAFPNFEPLCDIETIEEMASDEDIESRLIVKENANWSLEHGPFENLPDLETPEWTILIQGIDHHLPQAYDLLQQFRFIPDARLDDVMLSLASNGGGVGPHYDSYDVFLLQMHGTRRWKIGPLNNTTLIEGAPLKLLEQFEPAQDYLLEPGDMLYLPPNYGHDGVAQGVCSTLSIGFRALTKAEVLSALLHELADQVANDEQLKTTLFADPKRGIQKNPAEIPNDLLKFGIDALHTFSPETEDISKTIGKLLSEPKPNVYFINNTEEMTENDIIDILKDKGVSLSMQTRMLFKGNHVYINGDCISPKDPDCLKNLQDLAKIREINPSTVKKLISNPEYAFYLVGFAKAGWLGTML